MRLATLLLLPLALRAQEETITLQQAIQRGLQYNLKAVSSQIAEREAAARTLAARGQLLPDFNGDLRENLQQISLSAMGFRFPASPLFRFPSIIGPFNYFDLRVSVSQTIADLSRLYNYRATRENARGVALRAVDAREVIVLTVTNYYLQVNALQRRIDTVRAQIVTAEAAFNQAASRNKAGLIARIDVNRAQFQLQTQQQRLNALLNDVAKARLELARFIHAQQGQALKLADAQPFQPGEKLASVEDLVKQAFEQRPDMQVSQAQIRAAEEARKAAAAEYLPTLSTNADYGVIGLNPSQSHGTFSFSGTLHVPIFRSGRTKAEVEQATAALALRRAEYEDLRDLAERDVRTAMLDVDTAMQQIQLAEANRRLASETLEQARDRFGAGVTDTLELVQAQESLATAEQSYIDATLAYQVARIQLARATGTAKKSIR